MSSTSELQPLIEMAWESRASINAANSPKIFEAVEAVISDLNAGRLRVAERQGVGQWTVNQWVKKAVLPGSLLARESHGINPGAGRVRLALVAPADECLEAAHRIESFVRTL